MPRTLLSPPLVFLGLFALSRIVIAMTGAAPDASLVVDHWQHVDIALLKSDPLGSLWNLHSQPPLWNALLAIAVAIAGPDTAGVATAIHVFHIALSAIGGLLLLSMLERIGVPRIGAAVASAAALCLPSVVYLEMLPFYPHLTFFHVTLLAWLMFRVERGGSLWPVFAALGVLVSLSWIWAIFHPAFIVLFGGLLAWWSRGGLKAGAAVALAAMLAALPIIKNAIVFHSPSASSWVGLNLAQTATGLPLEQARHCDFLSAQHEIAAQPAPSGLHPSLTGATKPSGYPNMNHIGLIARSAECAGIAQADIRAHFGTWLQQRIAIFVHSHQLMSYNYVGDPRSRAAMELAEQELNPLSAAGRMTALASFLFLMFWCARQALRGEKRELHLCLFVLIGYFTVASHIANGVEQERMRYTIEPIYMLLAAEALMAVANLASRRRKPVEGAAG